MTKQTKGFIPIVTVILIAIIAIVLVGAAWWYESQSAEETNTVVNPNLNANLATNSNSNINVNGNINIGEVRNINMVVYDDENTN